MDVMKSECDILRRRAQSSSEEQILRDQILQLTMEHDREVREIEVCFSK